MKKIDIYAGMSIDEVCADVYDRALHGESLYFDFNGVRVSMYPNKTFKYDGWQDTIVHSSSPQRGGSRCPSR